jgi:hypothetical protein
MSPVALNRFSCEHVGRTNESDRAKVQGFIRVAEIRGATVVDSPNACPECKGRV